MKAQRVLNRIAAAAVLIFAAAIAAPAQNVSAGGATEAPKVMASDFAWMTGRWIGRMPKATAEQICSTPESGEMLCLFRVFVEGKPVMYELYTLYDTAAGLELRSLTFPTDLTEKSVRQPLLFSLQKYADREIVFAGAPGSQVTTSSLFRDTASTMNGVIMFADQKEPHIRVRWEKVAYDAKIDYNAPAQSGP